MINLIFVIIGFFPLFIGANFLVDSASSLAKKLNVPNLVIGLTIVALGTSTPELIVNIISSINKSSELALGNIIGSNIINILLILGVSSLIFPLSVKKSTTWLEIPFCFLSVFLLTIVVNDKILDNSLYSSISRIDGIVLLSFFCIFLVYNFINMKNGNFDEEIEVKNYSVLLSIFLLIIGIVLLIIGGKVIVTFAVKFAKALNISERIIAITIVSLGTSLPELATSAVAAKKKNVDIAVGNIVGSNIFNVFLVLGTSAVINPLQLSKGINFDLLINIFSCILLFIFIFISKNRKLERWGGIIFLLVYTAYIIMLVKNINFPFIG